MLMVRKFAYGFMVFAAMSAASAFAAGTLPAGYTEVEYIQGDGSGTRILTDYTPNHLTDKIEAVVGWDAVDKTATIWCTRGATSSTDSWTVFMVNDNGYKFRLDYGASKNGYASPLTVAANTKYTVTAEDKRIDVVGGAQPASYEYPQSLSFAGAGPIMLFASYWNGTGNNLDNYGKNKLYSFKVWRSGDLIHYFVPCKDSGGAATLVDICDNPATLTKSGTFTAGPEGHFYDDSLFVSYAILPIPTQHVLSGAHPEPGFTVTNFETGACWVYAEGGVASGATPFDVAYSFANGYGTVTATGKVGGECEGEELTRDYLVTDEFLLNGGFESGTLQPGWTGSDSTLSTVINASNGHKPNQTTTFITGTYCGMLKKTSSMEQVFTNESTYCVTLSWKCKHRCDWNSSVQLYYKVLLDGNVIYPEETTTGSDIRYRSVEDMILDPGEHTLRFEGRTVNNADTSLFFDDISLHLTTPLVILPIPDQSYNFGDIYRPEFTVSNVVNAQTWTIGGNIVSADFDVEYANNDGIGVATVTATGKGALLGNVVSATFNIFARYYAKPEVAEEGDGTSWGTAMSVTNFFATFGVVDEPCEVWIEAGTVHSPSLSITNNAALTIRGGFAGTETTLDERQPGALTILDGETTSTTVLTITSGTDDDIVLDRMNIRRARGNGFIRSGKGGLKVTDCVIEANGRAIGKVYGRGMNVQSDGYGSLVVSNCVFAGNRNVTQGDNYGGFGLYIVNFKNALVDRSLFVTNGFDILTPEGSVEGHWGWCGTNAKGSSIYANNTPITVRGCRFAGNNCPINAGAGGGTIHLAGASGGSVIDHCAFIGNSEHLSYQAQGSGLFGGCGALVVNLANATDKVSVDHCTFAYNLTGAGYSAGGISVVKGDVDIENSIFWKNIRYNTTTEGYGLDVQVGSTGTANIRHSTVTALDGTALGGAGLTYDPQTVFAADPKLVTTTEAFTNLLKVTSSKVYYDPGNATRYEDLASMDAHLKSPTGYFVNGGAAGPATTDYSPAIDAGDPAADYANEPAPNGGRLNAGAFGNTAEASRTATGQPNATVEVLYPDGEPRPVVQVTMGLESGTAYNATVRIVCSTGGVTLADEIYYGVGNGHVVEYKLPAYLPPGTEYTAAVTITAPEAETKSYTDSEVATGTLPPFYGKGGGPNVIHVREGADCKMDGTSWTDAYPDLATAFKSAPDASKIEVWLAVTNNYMTKSITLVSSLAIRGGFAGVENSADERAEGAMTKLDGNNNYRTLDFSVPSGATLTVERIHFAHSSQSELMKTGAGDLTVRDCWFTDSIRSGSFGGRGINAAGGTVTVSNCKFTNLVGPVDINNNGGDGIYLDACTAAYIDDCLFVTNGIPEFGRTKIWQARHKAAGVWVNATPAIFRNCRFSGSIAAMHESSGNGGILYFGGASGGSKLVNCVLVGNSDTQGSQSSVDIAEAGAIICSMSATDQTLDIENCTIAYNITQGQKTAAGITVIKGKVNVKNSIVYGNIRGLEAVADAAGADIEVRPNGSLDLSYSLVTGLTSNYIHAVTAENLTIGPGVIAGVDPLLATTTNDFHNLMTYQSGSPQHWYLPNEVRGTCAALDVHPRTHTGYMLNGMRIRDPEHVESPTIDAGDPKSDYSLEPEIPGAGGNGHRVNLGAYGNTPEAALTKPKGFYILLR